MLDWKLVVLPINNCVILGEKNLSCESFFFFPRVRELTWMFYKVPSNSTMAFSYEFEVSHVSLRRCFSSQFSAYLCVGGEGMGVTREVGRNEIQGIEKTAQ